MNDGDADDAPEFTANEVYEIQATDNVEGAASGASFGGIGLSNQPHQQLANRTAFLKQRQDVNISNIAALLAFMSGFTGTMGASGCLCVSRSPTPCAARSRRSGSGAPCCHRARSAMTGNRR